MLGHYQKIFRSRWSALFWAGCVLASTYFAVSDRAALPMPEHKPSPVASAKASAPQSEQSLDELIAAARAAEDARQEALREAAR